MSEAAHHGWGPSSLKQKINCLASDQATRGLPDVDSEHSLLGSAAHKLAELCNEQDDPARVYLGTPIAVKRSDGSIYRHEVTQETVDAVQFFLDHCNGLPGVDFNEQRVHYPQFVPGAFGTLDRARAGTVTYLRDYKHGTGVRVYAKDNEQLLGQALGFWLDWGHLFDITTFNVGVVQPRLDWVDVWEVSLEDVIYWARNTLVPAYKRAQEPNPPFTPGEWCTFCKIRGTCKVRIAQNFEQIVGDFEDLDDALDKVVTAPPLVGRYSNAEVAQILPMIPLMRGALNDLEKYAFAEVAAGRAVGTMKIVAPDGNRAWRQDVNVVEALDKLEVPDEKRYAPREFLTPPAMEKVLGKPLFAPAKLDKDGNVKKEAGPLYALIERKRGKPTLVPGDDPRPAITLNGAEDFEDLGEEE